MIYDEKTRTKFKRWETQKVVQDQRRYDISSIVEYKMNCFTNNIPNPRKVSCYVILIQNKFYYFSVQVYGLYQGR